jgi:anhydro-N-acetylmuramic acid kinase
MEVQRRSCFLEYCQTFSKDGAGLNALCFLCTMQYNVIGLMSGSSLDGLDIVYTFLDESRGVWKFDIQEAECVHYTDEWVMKLKHAHQLTAPDFLKLHTEYGRYLGKTVLSFIERHSLHHKVHFIASHGHTVFHEPEHGTSFQIGDGASLAALTGVPVISDLRSLDVALGGQGAPIVPIGDKLLFGDFDYWLNIGGIVNMTVKQGDRMMAFDVCTGNQMLNTLAQREGLAYDDEGRIAQSGVILSGVLEELSNNDYYKKAPPKSLSNKAAMELVFPAMNGSDYRTQDLLRTGVAYIADQIKTVIEKYPSDKPNPKLLATGGGALSNFLMEQIKETVAHTGVNVIAPYEQVVEYKEALVMALIGALRWREETNVLADVTGAKRDSVSGAIWMGHSFNGQE